MSTVTPLAPCRSSVKVPGALSAPPILKMWTPSWPAASSASQQGLFYETSDPSSANRSQQYVPLPPLCLAHTLRILPKHILALPGPHHSTDVLQPSLHLRLIDVSLNVLLLQHFLPAACPASWPMHGLTCPRADREALLATASQHIPAAVAATAPHHCHSCLCHDPTSISASTGHRWQKSAGAACP